MFAGDRYLGRQADGGGGWVKLINSAEGAEWPDGREETSKENARYLGS